MTQPRPTSPWPNPPSLPPSGPCLEPTPFDLGVADDPVAVALADLSHFGPDIDRTTVDRLLDLWARRADLTDEMRAQVLAYYPEMEP